MEPPLTADLLRAYRETDYVVYATPSFTLRIDVHSAPLAALHAQHRTGCSAYVSACNPYSQRLTDGANAALHTQLGQRLTHRGLIVLEGIGRHPSASWPGEPSYLVLDLPLPQARELGNAWRQNAILWSGEDAVPRLVLLR